MNKIHMPKVTYGSQEGAGKNSSDGDDFTVTERKEDESPLSQVNKVSNHESLSKKKSIPGDLFKQGSMKGMGNVKGYKSPKLY